MRVDIAVRSGTGNTFLQAPDEWEFRIDYPILRVAGAVMENFTDRAVLDHFLRVRNGGNAAVVMANHVHDLRSLGSVQHFLALSDIHPERFFAEDVFTGLCGGDGDFR